MQSAETLEQKYTGHKWGEKERGGMEGRNMSMNNTYKEVRARVYCRRLFKK